MSPTAYYFPADPPYLLFAISLLAGLACGSAFERVLRQNVRAWSEDKLPLNLKGNDIKVPYLGITLSIGGFLGAGLEIFGFPPSLAYTVALPLTLGSAYFVWRQLGKMLVEFEQGGSAAMDLDSF